MEKHEQVIHKKQTEYEIESEISNKLIRVEDVSHYFYRKNQDGEVTQTQQVLNKLSLHVSRGDFICILGRNGSGKSTLAKMLNALLIPSEGTIWVGDIATAKEERWYEIRQITGMVFQNPDNQLVSPVVEEDVGFGPENLGLPREEIWERVEQALRSVDMWEYRKCSPNQLSGGQKQRVAIAGILAMKPVCIVMDEPTAMLDPVGRDEIIYTLHQLNKMEGVTVILITHNMEEVIGSDYVYCMDAGKIVVEGTPKEIFSQEEIVEQIGLELPVVTKLAWELRKQGMDLERGILTKEDLYHSLNKKGYINKIKEKKTKDKKTKVAKQDLDKDTIDIDENKTQEIKIKENTIDREVLLQLKHISYQYNKNSKVKDYAIKNISMKIYQGEFLGIIGETGSGKSTLMQHLNGLIKPKEGEVLYRGKNIFHKGIKLSQVRFSVGLVFQYPEYQLFKETVLEDVMFGPEHQGIPVEKAKERAIWALEQVQLSRECWDKSPFVLSGGQKRKAALAGILALKPEILVLDEPTAGLDPQGRKQILQLLKRLQLEENMTIVMVSHSMDQMAEYADRIICMRKGSIAMEGTPNQIFGCEEKIRKCGLDVPQIIKIIKHLCGGIHMDGTDCIRMCDGVKLLSEN